jgi:hypothetical protein
MSLAHMQAGFRFSTPQPHHAQCRRARSTDNAAPGGPSQAHDVGKRPNQRKATEQAKGSSRAQPAGTRWHPLHLIMMCKRPSPSCQLIYHFISAPILLTLTESEGVGFTEVLLSSSEYTPAIRVGVLQGVSAGRPTQKSRGLNTAEGSGSSRERSCRMGGRSKEIKSQVWAVWQGPGDKGGWAGEGRGQSGAKC